MAAQDGPRRNRGAAGRAHGIRILFGSPQWLSSMQCPQQSQSRGRSQGNIESSTIMFECEIFVVQFIFLSSCLIVIWEILLFNI